MNVWLKAALKVVPASCAVLYGGIITVGCAVMNQKEGLHLNPIKVMFQKS